MKLYVNSGNTIVHEGIRYHSGSLLPDEIIDLWDKETIERLISQDVILDKTPILDPIKDVKTGSANINKGSQSPKKEDFSAKQLGKELDKKQKSKSKSKGKQK